MCTVYPIRVVSRPLLYDYVEVRVSNPVFELQSPLFFHTIAFLGCMVVWFVRLSFVKPELARPSSCLVGINP